MPGTVPCVLERFVIFFDMTLRTLRVPVTSSQRQAFEALTEEQKAEQMQISCALQDPICISAGVPQALFIASVGQQWDYAYARHASTFPSSHPAI